MKPLLVINCPAPYYIQHSVCHYEEAKQSGRRVGIVVTDTLPVYSFLESLKLDLDFLEFIPSDPTGAVTLGRPAAALSSHRFYRGIEKLVAKKMREAELWYFGAHNYGPVSALVAAARRIGISVTNVGWPANDTRYDSPKGLRMSLRKTLLEWVTSCPLRYASLGDSLSYQNLLFIDEQKLSVRVAPGLVEPRIPDRYLFTPANSDVSLKNILLLDGRDEESYKNYEARMVEILSPVKDRGWKVFLKPHPRLGSSQFFECIVDGMIPAFVPAQFISRNAFSAVISNISAAMGTFANEGIPTISLEYLHERREPLDREYFVSMLTNPVYFPDPRKQIMFPSSLDGLLAALPNTSSSTHS